MLGFHLFCQETGFMRNLGFLCFVKHVAAYNQQFYNSDSLMVFHIGRIS
jgi:hypothetical protein